MILLFLSLFNFAFSSTIIAHKGLTNPFSFEAAGCHTRNLTSIDHHYVENTLPSIMEAYRLGADVVEIDLRLTKEGELVLYQGQSLDCQSNKQGMLWHFSLAELKTVRPDWNLSADDGKSYPWRKRTPVYIPSFHDLLKVNGCRPLMLNPKDQHHHEAVMIVKNLLPLKCDWKKFSFWGSVETYQYIKKNIPDFGPFIPNHHHMDNCLKSYAAWGAFGYWPPVCKKEVLSIDVRNIPWDLWQWPGGFTEIARKNGSQVWAYGANDNDKLRRYYLSLDGIITSLIYRSLDVTPLPAP